MLFLSKEVFYIELRRILSIKTAPPFKILIKMVINYKLGAIFYLEKPLNLHGRQKKKLANVNMIISLIY